jgi:hypothetical protein
MSGKRFKAALVVAGVGVASLAAAPSASADPVVTTASGADAAAIQAAVDAYRNSLGANNGGGPAQPAGRREINWDGVPDERSAPSFMPEGQFRARGALFSTPGIGVQVSGDDDNDGGNPDADPDQIEFANLNAGYPGAFAPFSAERLFAAVGSNVIDTEFVIPATDTPAQTNGFGVVFTDVDVAGQTTIELLDPAGESLGTFAAPASAGDEDLSFLGIKLDPGVGAVSARITSGNAALGVADVTQGGAADVVATDDFIYGEPQAIPEPEPEPEPPAPAPEQPDTDDPQLTVEGVDDEVRPGAFAKGLRLEVTTDEPATIDARLVATTRRVELARGETRRVKANVLLAEKSLGLEAGERRLRVKPKRKVVRGADELKAELRVAATDTAGNRTVVRRKISVG